MTLYEHGVEVGLEPTRLFAELNDVAVLSAHMPRTAEASAEPSEVWLRVDEPDCTVSWGSPQHCPGSLDVLPEAPGRSRLVVRVNSETDVTAQLMIAVEALRTRVEESRAA